MKTLLIATLGLLATSVYAQPGPGLRGEVLLPAVKADIFRESTPSMPHQEIPRPVNNMNFSNSLENIFVPSSVATPSPSMPANDVKGPTTVGATGVTTPIPPLPGNDAKGPTSVGASQSGAQARAETKSERQTKNETERMAAAIVTSELVILYNTIPSVGVPPPTVRAEMPREAIPLPANDAKAPNSVGALLGSGENGGNVGLTASQNSLTGVITVTGPNGETRESCGMDACTTPPPPPPPTPPPTPSPVKQRAQAEIQDKAQALVGGGSIGGNVAATGVTTPIPPLPGNDAKGPTSVVDGVIESVARDLADVIAPAVAGTIEALIESFVYSQYEFQITHWE